MNGGGEENRKDKEKRGRGERKFRGRDALGEVTRAGEEECTKMDKGVEKMFRILG